MKCPICASRLRRGICPQCGFQDSSAQKKSPRRKKIDFTPFLRFWYLLDENGKSRISKEALVGVLFLVSLVVVPFLAASISSGISSFTKNMPAKLGLPQIYLTEEGSQKASLPQGIPQAERQVVWQERGVTIELLSISWKQTSYGGSTYFYLSTNFFISNSSDQTVTVSSDSIRHDDTVRDAGGQVTLAAGEEGICRAWVRVTPGRKETLSRIQELSVLLDLSFSSKSAAAPAEEISLELPLEITLAEWPFDE